VGKGAKVGKSKKMGFNFYDPKQNGIFDNQKISEHISDERNWKNVREDNPTTAPLQQLTLTFDQPGNSGRNAVLQASQRVRMQTTGRLRVTAGKVRNPADAARLLSQFSSAAQENLFTIAMIWTHPSLTSNGGSATFS